MWKVVRNDLQGERYTTYFVSLRNAEEYAQTVRNQLLDRLMWEAGRLTGTVRGKGAEKFRAIKRQISNLHKTVEVSEIQTWD